MKNRLLLFQLIMLTFLIYSCRKEEQFIDPSSPRLLGYEAILPGGTPFHYTIDYDMNGRINRVATYEGNDPPTILWNISYSANEILMAQPVGINSLGTITDTIRLILDGRKRVRLRIQNRLWEYFGNYDHLQRSYRVDTLSYSYDLLGPLRRTTHTGHDSTWLDDGISVMYTTRRISGLTNYSYSAGSLLSVSEVLTSDTLRRNSSAVLAFPGRNESTITFEYRHQYPNKTDFSNLTVLNELRIISSLPMVKKSPYLPDKISYFQMARDPLTGASYFYNYAYEFEYGYDEKGFVSSRRDQSNPDLRLTYLYRD